MRFVFPLAAVLAATLQVNAGTYRSWFFDGADCIGPSRPYMFPGADDTTYGEFDRPVAEGGDGSDPKR